MFQIDKAFNPETTNVYGFYQKPGVGLYIPLYQREYSWDKDNIDQLLDDVAQGIFSITENEDEIRFLGTVIAVQVRDIRSIHPIDRAGLPSLIENIIDGQQRLSTIALFSTLLYHHIWKLQQKIPKSTEANIKSQVDEVCEYWKEKLLDVFSLDLKRGTPRRKPKIIRGNRDQWTKDGNVDNNYKSNVANYIASFVNYIDEEQPDEKIPAFIRKTRTGDNLRRIDRWLKSTVIKAHEEQAEDFITAWEILLNIDQAYIWQYEREELHQIIKVRETKDKRALEYLLCSLVQLFAVSHYLLERCCFTIIQPMNEEWAFDMFQSLNATGTPLTAIETFKPSVVQVVKDADQRFKDSLAEKSFEKVDALFEGAKTAAKKSSLTKDLLTSFALTVEGKKLGSHFSQQRKWLIDTFTKEFADLDEQINFVQFFGNYAVFYKEAWLDYDGKNGLPISRIATHEEAGLASLLILYLKDSNHKMAITILGRFYADIIQGKERSISNFIEATRLIARFYTIWRSAQSNSGLDKQYRNFLKRPLDDDKQVMTEASNAWLDNPQIDLEKLKAYFNAVLGSEENKLLDKAIWKSKALTALKYNKAKSVCKLALFISAHNTIPDETKAGLMKAGKEGTAEYLTLNKWVSDDLKTIEHIAPRNGDRHWDESFYSEDEWSESIGNLTLLPTKINSSAGNKGWKAKYIYYQFLNEADTEKHQTLKNKAQNLEVELQDSTLKLLQEAKFNHHMKSIVSLGDYGDWTADLVEARAGRMLDILWAYLLR